MASYSHLRKLAAIEREGALAVLDELLPEDPDARKALLVARRDVIGKTEPDFQVNALVGALARVVLEQQRQIDELREARTPGSPKRAKKASSAAK
jgi:hypothetical protein